MLENNAITHTLIPEALRHLEEKHDIKILYAVESGSRAWGFASANSDWDVRYLYLHKPDWYLSIDEKKDSLETFLPHDLDLSGWELRKALNLFKKSNPALLEWLQSPLIYAENGETAEKLRLLTAQYFNAKACLHHYLNMAINNYKGYLQKEQVRVKKYFYVLRPLLACDYIRLHDGMIPVEFETLLNQVLLNQAPLENEVKGEIEKLVVRKRAGEELTEESQNAILNHFIDEKIEFYHQYLKKVESPKQPDNTALNQLFREILKKTWAL
ncbi:nucleotidyltransferase domain-containing protein [Hugenholtzia roseola]|uniref:nucleotidyltransferase domain-containing protein n=1 Tax=Hugenholtzia roseola TaxID=1002 RepID=UPI0003FC95BA|nr:nucleotidyltransferase domain-containing protein [Hugenholtzia roseola]